MIWIYNDMFESFYDNELKPGCCKSVNMRTHFFVILLSLANLLNLIYKLNRILEIDPCNLLIYFSLVIYWRETNFTLGMGATISQRQILCRQMLETKKSTAIDSLRHPARRIRLLHLSLANF